jgi:hypothetical protein
VALDQLVNGELPVEDYPFVNGGDVKSGLESEKQAVSLKKEKEASDWAEKGKSKDKVPEPGAPRQTVSRFGSAVVVFVLGGMSYRYVARKFSDLLLPPFSFARH